MKNKLLLKSYKSNATLHLRDVVSVQHDLDTVNKYLALISTGVEDDQKQQTISQALWTSAIVTFFKCFAGGVRKYKLDKSIFSMLPGEPLDFYEYMKNVRDRHIAHSVSTLEETIVGPLLDPREKRLTGTARITAKYVMGSDETLINFQKLVRLAREEVQVEFASANKIVESELNEFSYEEMGKSNLYYSRIG